jgi:hypothetical protein
MTNRPNRINTGAYKNANEIQTFGQSGLAFDSSRYDTFTLQGSKTQYSYFKNGTGTKGYALTNMEDDSQFPTGVAFMVHEIGLRIEAPATGADPVTGAPVAVTYTEQDVQALLQALSQFYLQFNVVGFQYMGQWSVDEWLGALNIAFNEATASGTASSTIFSPVSAWKRLRTPIALQSRAIFSLDMNFASAQNNSTLGVGAGDFSSAVLTSCASKPWRIRWIIRGIEQRRGS